MSYNNEGVDTFYFDKYFDDNNETGVSYGYDDDNNNKRETYIYEDKQNDEKEYNIDVTDIIPEIEEEIDEKSIIDVMTDLDDSFLFKENIYKDNFNMLNLTMVVISWNLNKIPFCNNNSKCIEFDFWKYIEPIIDSNNIIIFCFQDDLSISKGDFFSTFHNDFLPSMMMKHNDGYFLLQTKHTQNIYDINLKTSIYISYNYRKYVKNIFSKLDQYYDINSIVSFLFVYKSLFLDK